MEYTQAGYEGKCTCQYILTFLGQLGKQEDQWTPTQMIEQPDFGSANQIAQDPESLIVAMERVTVLFDRYCALCNNLNLII